MARYVIFTLGMPNRASWNGKWSGEEKEFRQYITLTKGMDESKLASGYFYYNFGDGWGASVSTQIVDGAKAKNAIMKNADTGFCGYGWMVDSIIKHGVIKCD